MPYFVRIVSRKAIRPKNPLITSSSEENYGNESHDERDLKKRNSKSSPKKSRKKHNLNNKEEVKKDLLRCIFCNRKNCDDCPLPFDDKTTLRKYLEKCKASNESKFYYMDDEEYSEKRNQAKTKNSTIGMKSCGSNSK